MKVKVQFRMRFAIAWANVMCRANRLIGRERALRWANWGLGYFGKCRLGHGKWRRLSELKHRPMLVEDRGA